MACISINPLFRFPTIVIQHARTNPNAAEESKLWERRYRPDTRNLLSREKQQHKTTFSWSNTENC